MKLSFGEGGFQGFVVRHCEKIALGFALFLMLGFLYWGWSIEPYEKTPEDLSRMVEQARSNINESTWNNVRDERVPVSNYAARVDQGRNNILPHEYAMPNPFKPAEVRPVVKRNDPALFAPIKLEVDAVVGPVAVPSEGKPDLLALKESAKPKEPEKKPRPTSRGRRGPTGVPSSDPFGAGGEGVPGSGAMLGGSGAMPDSGMGMPDESGMTGDGTSQMAGGTRRMPAEYAEGWQAPTTAMTPGQAPPLVPKSHNIVAVKALVPYEQQFDEFSRVLENSYGYNASYDRPKYIAFVAERAEVGSDPDAALNWVKVSSTGLALKEVRDWVAAGSEQVDENYLLPNVLTMPIPPLMMRSHRDLFGHSEVPRKNAAQPTTTPDQPEDGTAPKNEGNPDLPEDIPSFAGNNFGPGGMSGPGGMAGPGGMMSGPGGMMSGPGGMEGAGMEEPGMGSPGMMSGPGGMMSGPGGMGSAPGSGNMGSPYGQQLTKYKLVRFYDMTAQPGKTYVYRVQVWLEDPNRPKDRSVNLRVLEADVLTRLKQVAEDEKSAGHRIFYRKSEWSDPSPPISLPDMRAVYAGTVEGMRRTQVIKETNTGAQMQIEEPAGKMVAVSWDPRFATDVALETDVKRGTVFNAQKDIDVVHPVTLEFKTLDEYSFKTDSIVLDIRGGEELGGTRDDPIHALGNYVVFNPDGTVSMHNELEEVDKFRRFTYAAEQASTGVGGMGGGMDGMMPGGFPGSGMDGMEGGGIFGPTGGR